MLSRMKAVFFDLDGTLIDSGKVVLESFRHALDPFGVNVTYELLETIRTRPAERLFGGLIDASQHSLALKRLRDFTQAAAPQMTPFAGIEGVLSDLSDARVPMAVWTGRDRISALHILKANRLDHH